MIVTQQAELPKSQEVERQPSIDGAVQKAEEDTTPKEETLSPKFAQLARKEKALRSHALALKAREEELKAKQAEYESSYVSKASLAERIQKDPMAVLNENGISYDQLVQTILNQPAQKDPELVKIQAQLEALEKQTQTQKQTFEEQQTKAYEQAVNQIRTEAKLLVDSDPQFETIKETSSQEAVVELIKETFEKDGTLLTVEDAAKEVEAYLLEEALKMAQLKKVKEKLMPQPEAEKTPLNQKTPIKTLTNAQTASSKPLTAQERRQRAILAFEGKLQT